MVTAFLSSNDLTFCSGSTPGNHIWQPQQVPLRSSSSHKMAPNNVSDLTRRNDLYVAYESFHVVVKAHSCTATLLTG